MSNIRQFKNYHKPRLTNGESFPREDNLIQFQQGKELIDLIAEFKEADKNILLAEFIDYIHIAKYPSSLLPSSRMRGIALLEVLVDRSITPAMKDLAQTCLDRIKAM